MPAARLPTLRLAPNPRTDRLQQSTTLAVLPFPNGRDIEATHARPAHQLRHAVDDDDGVVVEPFKCSHEARRVLAVHDVYDENHVRNFEIAFNFQPLAIAERRAEVVRSYTQAELMNTIDLSLCVFQRREQTRTHI